MADLLDVLRAKLPADFSVSEYIKKGGQGSVFSGKFRDGPAALKLFLPDADPRRLKREIELLSSRMCPTLVSVLGTTEVEIDGTRCPLVAYELLPGGDLRSSCEPTADLFSENALRRVGADVMAALTWLWRERIVHRDVKPDNIVKRSHNVDDGFVLVDVAFARHVDRSCITLPGYAVGTRGYQSPEQATGRRNLTVRSDVFSLGVTLFELAAQRHPWSGNQHQIGIISPPALSSIRKDLSPEFCATVSRMLTTSVVARPALVDFDVVD